MSRILNRRLPSILGSGNSRNANRRQPGPTTSTLPAQAETIREHRGKSFPGNRSSSQRLSDTGGLELPEYTSNHDISYDEFLQRIRGLNHDSTISSDRAFQALQSTFKSLVGAKRFSAMNRMERQGRGDQQAALDKGDWDRLMFEMKQYEEADKKARAEAEATRKAEADLWAGKGKGGKSKGGSK